MDQGPYLVERRKRPSLKPVEREGTMTELTRREFLLIGVAGGAVAAVGVIVPLSQTRSAEQVAVGDGSSSTTTTLPPPPSAVVGFFPKVRVASVGDLSTTDPVKFDYPLQGQRNVLVKLSTSVSYGMGPDQDSVSFSSICTHMGCLLEEYKPEYNALGPCPCHFSTFDPFLFPGSPANAVTPGDTNLQPINLRYNFKLGKGVITKIGTTDLVGRMSFVPRNLV